MKSLLNKVLMGASEKTMPSIRCVGIFLLLGLASRVQGAQYQHLIMYGQSLSTGQQSWPPLSTEAVDNNFMLGRQVWSNMDNPELKHLNPLVANVAVRFGDEGKARNNKVTAESPIVAAANHIQLKTEKPHNLIATSCGYPGRTIEELSKEYYAPGHYRDFLKALNSALSLSPDLHCPAIFWMQGEYNYIGRGCGLTQGSTSTADKDEYKTLLLTLKSNMQADIMAKYGQPDRPLFITYQAGAQYSKGMLGIGMAQLEASNEHEDIVCAGPVYPMTDRGGHLDPNGYRWFGEMLGKVYYKTKIAGEDFKPLQPLAISRASNPRTLEIEFLAPQLPLVLDESLVAKTKDYGFEVYNNGERVAIMSIAVKGSRIILVCNSDLTGDLDVVYAGEGTSGHGNLRDSDPYRAAFNYLDLDRRDSQGNYVYERDDTETTLRPPYEPKDENGAVLYEQPYPLYNFCVAFAYRLPSGERVHRCAFATANGSSNMNWRRAESSNRSLNRERSVCAHSAGKLKKQSNGI